MTLFWRDGRPMPDDRFPDPRLADRHGLLAIGGNLEPKTLLQAYRQGIFPWSVDPITWWSPDPRAVFSLDGLHLSRRVARICRQGRLQVTFNTAFQKVMEGCAAPGPGRGQTWISPEFVAAYGRLHQLGQAHSVEVWLGDELAGGVYGVAVGGLFAGESMFHRVANASTVALAALFQRLREKGFCLFDSQVASPHTLRLGAQEIRRADYLQRLKSAVELRCSFS